VTAPALDPRKSPRQRRSQATVEVIVEGAARILEAEGPDGFNTIAIACAAGVSVGSLYQYFPGKQALIAELSRRNAEEVLAGLAEAARTQGSPVLERLRAFAAFAIAQQGARLRQSQALDQLKTGLGLATDEVASGPAILEILTPVLAGAAAPGAIADLPRIAGDCLALSRTLIDRALDAGAGGRDGLEARLVGALAGYLRAAGPKV
jgi:AcrR family transcriptional regulator